MSPLAASMMEAVPLHAVLAAEAAATKASGDSVVLEMAESLGVVDAFVVTSGRNARQVRTIVEEVERQLGGVPGGQADQLAGPSGAVARKPVSVEGLADATWVLMDYGDFVVHVFLEEAREFYDLEHLWARAPRFTVSAEQGAEARPHGAL